MTSGLGSMWYERKMEDFGGQNVRAQGATTQPRAGKIFCVGDTSFENYCTKLTRSSLRNSDHLRIFCQILMSLRWMMDGDFKRV
jgi:hypothetical protein